jgi:hypothetical protein
MGSAGFEPRFQHHFWRTDCRPEYANRVPAPGKGNPDALCPTMASKSGAGQEFALREDHGGVGCPPYLHGSMTAGDGPGRGPRSGAERGRTGGGSGREARLRLSRAAALVELEVRDGLGLRTIEGGVWSSSSVCSNSKSRSGWGRPRAGETGGGVAGTSRCWRTACTGRGSVRKARMRMSALTLAREQPRSGNADPHRLRSRGSTRWRRRAWGARTPS